ncbi:MAG: hypothetical protein ACK47R_14285, partial [Planctomycetia bacterium]
ILTSFSRILRLQKWRAEKIMGLATTNGWLRRKWAGMHPKKNDLIDFRHHNLSGRVTYANNVASVDVPQV